MDRPNDSLCRASLMHCSTRAAALDHLVGAHEQCDGDGKAKCLGGFEPMRLPPAPTRPECGARELAEAYLRPPATMPRPFTSRHLRSASDWR